MLSNGIGIGFGFEDGNEPDLPGIGIGFGFADGVPDTPGIGLGLGLADPDVPGIGMGLGLVDEMGDELETPGIGIGFGFDRTAGCKAAGDCRNLLASLRRLASKAAIRLVAVEPAAVPVKKACLLDILETAPLTVAE